MVARGGCLASITSRTDEKTPREGAFDEMRVRCPRPEHLSEWFAGVDKLTAKIAVEPVKEDTDDDGEEVVLPAASLVTSRGLVVEVKNSSDAARILSEVHALSNQLASAEMPKPGPRSLGGWEMLHVSGPAHVVFHGSDTNGVLEARVSTSGQYLCEYTTSRGNAPLRATKSGWISPGDAADAIDEVLSPFAELEGSDARTSTVAAGTKGGTERRASTASTAAVFVRFANMQDALGDACLPELEPPAGAASQVRL